MRFLGGNNREKLHGSNLAATRTDLNIERRAARSVTPAYRITAMRWPYGIPDIYYHRRTDICVAFRPYVCAFDAAAPVRAGEFHRQHRGGAGGPQAPEARAQAERATMSLKDVDFQSKS